jgi:hypothetical protein
VPLSDEGLEHKFAACVATVFERKRVDELLRKLWSIDGVDNVAPLIESMIKPR